MKSDARQQSHSVELRSLLKHLASRARIAFGDKKAQLAFRYLVNGALMVGIIVVSPSLSHAEIRFEAAQFYFTWARLAEFFDFASTGNTILTIPPARSDQAEPVVVRSFALCSEEDCPTTAVYDLTSPFSIEVPLAGCCPSPHCVIAWLPETRRIRWNDVDCTLS